MATHLVYVERLLYIEHLAERKQTGTPSELAKKLGVSKRTIKRMVAVLRLNGVPIKYNRILRTYEILKK